MRPRSAGESSKMEDQHPLLASCSTCEFTRYRHRSSLVLSHAWQLFHQHGRVAPRDDDRCEQLTDEAVDQITRRPTLLVTSCRATVPSAWRAAPRCVRLAAHCSGGCFCSGTFWRFCQGTCDSHKCGSVAESPELDSQVTRHRDAVPIHISVLWSYTCT